MTTKEISTNTDANRATLHRDPEFKPRTPTMLYDILGGILAIAGTLIALSFAIILIALCFGLALDVVQYIRRR